MSNLIFNLRIGKIHFQITNEWKFAVSLNQVHDWFAWPVIELYCFGRWNKD